MSGYFRTMMIQSLSTGNKRGHLPDSLTHLFPQHSIYLDSWGVGFHPSALVRLTVALLYWEVVSISANHPMQETYNSSLTSPGKQNKLPRCELSSALALPMSRHNASILPPWFVHRATWCLISSRSQIAKPDLDIICATTSTLLERNWCRHNLSFKRWNTTLINRARIVSVSLRRCNCVRKLYDWARGNLVKSSMLLHSVKNKNGFSFQRWALTMNVSGMVIFEIFAFLNLVCKRLGWFWPGRRPICLLTLGWRRAHVWRSDLINW